MIQNHKNRYKAQVIVLVIILGLASLYCFTMAVFSARRNEGADNKGIVIHIHFCPNDSTIIQRQDYSKQLSSSVDEVGKAIVIVTSGKPE